MADESSQEKQLRWFGMAIAVLIIGFGLVVALAGGVLTSVLIVEQFKGAKPGELGLWIFGGGMLVAGVGAIVYGTSLFHRARTDPSVTATKTLPAGEHRALAWVGVVLS